MEYKFVHVSIRVMDLEKSLKFYKDFLGMKETKRKEYPKYKFDLVFLTDKEENFELELTYNYEPEKPYVIGDGFAHLAYYVKDLEKSFEEFKSAGYEVSDFSGLPGNMPNYFFVKDPDGYNVEIIRAK